MSKSLLAIKIAKMICIHDWDVKSWRYALVYPKLPEALVISTCRKCGKVRLLKPEKECFISVSGKQDRGMSECGANINRKVIG